MAGALLACLMVTVCPQVAGAGGVSQVDSRGIDLLLDAIAKVESRHDPSATGDGGKASGMYQIHRAYWADGTRLLGVDWSYEQATDSVKAREVVKAYLLYYGRGCSLLEMARIHNGGPNGHHKRSTLEYARRIARAMADMRPAQRHDPT